MITTPLMTQYYKIKQENPDMLLLFRVGDFFETFDEDAKLASKVLGITLTKRSHGAANDVPLAGFPHHAIDTYLPKLVRNGLRVAICEQIENPKFAKGIVKREVVEIVTPGVTFSDKLLDNKKNNFLFSVAIEGERAGIAVCDVSTGEFLTFETDTRHLLEQLLNFFPAEIVTNKKNREYLENLVKKSLPLIRISRLDDWIYNRDFTYELLTNHFQTKNLKGFGIEENELEIISSGAALFYLKETQKNSLSHIRTISEYNTSEFMVLDIATMRNLEIIYSSQDGSKEGTLINVLDFTKTSMGGRLFKKWLIKPLLKLDKINLRLNSVEELVNNKKLRTNIQNELNEVDDFERLISKICTGRANPKDLINLKISLKKIPLIKQLLDQGESELLKKINDNLLVLESTILLIEETINDDAPLAISDGSVIKKGYNNELDELRDIAHNSKNFIANLQSRERERTKINSLKISYNRVFGYYIDISNVHKEKVPDDYIRKQTLVNSERYITPVLKEYEEKILTAEDKIIDIESEIFNNIRTEVAKQSNEIQSDSRQIAILDCIQSLSQASEEYNYTKPKLSTEGRIDIKDGRHPVVERILPPGTKFTPNDVILTNDDTQIIIITGPNMSGKSVFLRQVGLIVLMAQIGSYVPAKEAEIGIVDRIFTRVGANDNMAAGESTFLVEMQEAANILNNATNKSLILLDEVGRGTSTFDGISIAWAITEYLHENPYQAAKTLFATHYHELNEMAEIFERIKNFRVDVREIEDKVIFLHKVKPGGADFSYGIQVAQMAGLPIFVTNRAKEILLNLESKESTPYETKQLLNNKKKSKDENQLSLFEIKDDALRTELSGIDIDGLTPIDALNKLNELKKKLK